MREQLEDSGYSKEKSKKAYTEMKIHFKLINNNNTLKLFQKYI